jgi:hypothetical protein
MPIRGHFLGKLGSRFGAETEELVIRNFVPLSSEAKKPEHVVVWQFPAVIIYVVLEPHGLKQQTQG